MATLSLDDIFITPLKRIPTEGGEVMHAIKHFEKGHVEIPARPNDSVNKFKVLQNSKRPGRKSERLEKRIPQTS